MGVVKRIDGWRRSGWPIPNTLQMLVGLIPYRDPEAFLERKRAAREAERERTAMQTESSVVRHPSSVVPQAMPSSTRDNGPRTTDLEDAGGSDLGVELPVRAADGWYRVGRSFYRLGQGPFADWSLATPPRAPATRQGMLF